MPTWLFWILIAPVINRLALWGLPEIPGASAIALAIALLPIALTGGLGARIRQHLSRLASREHVNELKELLARFPDEENPRYPQRTAKRLARFETQQAGRTLRCYQLLIEPIPFKWTGAGPVFAGWITHDRSDAVWYVEIPFEKAKASLRLDHIVRGLPNLIIDLYEGEVAALMTCSAGSIRAQDHAENSFLTAAAEMIEAAYPADRKGLSTLRQMVAKRIHPDAGPASERHKRTEAIAYANHRIDLLLKEISS